MQTYFMLKHETDKKTNLIICKGKMSWDIDATSTPLHSIPDEFWKSYNAWFYKYIQKNNILHAQYDSCSYQRKDGIVFCYSIWRNNLSKKQWEKIKRDFKQTLRKENLI